MTPEVRDVYLSLMILLDDLTAVDVDILVKYFDVDPMVASVHVDNAKRSLAAAIAMLADDHG